MNRFIFALCLCVLPAISFSQPYAPFLPDTTYSDAVASPSEYLEYEFGVRPVLYQEVRDYFELLAESSPLVTLEEYGKTHEGHDLFYIVVTSAENHRSLDRIQENIGKLADPRLLISAAEARTIIENSPAIAWMAYNIHGGELSGTDAAVWLAYYLVAGEDERREEILESAVVVIDPLMNPDGRERYLDERRKYSGYVPNPDTQSIQHNGLWVSGRGNHYFFDLNRDFFILSQPETKARVETYLQWNPQLYIDAHEMGSQDTYLFSPPREPIHHHLNPGQEKWRTRFAEDQATAFDEFGWSYYTREWLDSWYPGYTEWISYTGAIHILYEQARVNGSLVMRQDGTTVTYRQSVHHQLTSSVANLETLADVRQPLLQDYFDERNDGVEAPSEDVYAYCFPPIENTSRLNQLIENLLHQGIEITQTTSAVTLTGVNDTWGNGYEEQTLPAGSYLVKTQQPLQRLVNVLLEFDPRMTDSTIQQERASLEQRGRSRQYDVTSWCMPIAYGVECWTTAEPFDVATLTITEAPSVEGAFPNDTPAYGYALSNKDDASTFAVTRLLQHGIAVRASDEPFMIGDTGFPRGSYLIRSVEQQDFSTEDLATIAEDTGATFVAANTALNLDSIDLGGRHFDLLAEPRVAVLMGRGISTYSYGEVWHWLDATYRYRMSSLDVDSLGRYDLRLYNTMIIPDGNLPGSVMDDIEEWIRDGGTAIAIGGAAEEFMGGSSPLSLVVDRRDALEDMHIYLEAAERERLSLEASATQSDIWDYDPETYETAADVEIDELRNLGWLERKERWESRFRPRGAFLKAKAFPFHWLAYGMDEDVPVMVRTGASYFSRPPVQTALRFVGTEDIRISGLLWPEMRGRYAQGAAATRESLGDGQIILLPYEANERGYYPNTTRLLWNAVFLGPGLGADQPRPW